jgi:hypothetical protein
LQEIAKALTDLARQRRGDGLDGQPASGVATAITIFG